MKMFLIKYHLAEGGVFFSTLRNPTVGNAGLGKKCWKHRHIRISGWQNRDGNI